MAEKTPRGNVAALFTEGIRNKEFAWGAGKRRQSAGGKSGAEDEV